MGEIVDRLPGVIAPHVAGDRLGPGDDPDRRRAGQERERPADVRVGNRVVIPIEADIGRLAGDHGAQDVGGEGMRRKREEPRLLLREHLRDGVIGLLGMGPLVRHLVAPPPKLGIQVIDIGKRPRGKELMTEVLNLPLDFALLVSPARRTRTRREVIVAGELE